MKIRVSQIHHGDKCICSKLCHLYRNGECIDFCAIGMDGTSSIFEKLRPGEECPGEGTYEIVFKKVE